MTQIVLAKRICLIQFGYDNIPSMLKDLRM